MLLTDTLSRAHLAETAEEISEDDMRAKIHLLTSNISVSDEQIKQIKNATSSDESMIKVAQYIENGWPTHIQQVDSVTKQSWHFREDLTIIDEIIFKGERIFIPSRMQKDILMKLHQAHLDIEKTKLRARETVFWPGINQDIERAVKLCTTCQELRNSNSEFPQNFQSFHKTGILFTTQAA